MHLPHLISDLALILLVAGVITILFKRLKQPLVLGYIVAGMMTGPYLTGIITSALAKINLSVTLPVVVDRANIEVWSEIGVIFLMFALGLEFSLTKLADVGRVAIITATTEVSGMLLIGFGIGIAMGWSTTDSLILGGILSMSSTTIIIKAFEEMKLKGRKFTELVFGGLIVEDIVGIFIMVFLSTYAVSHGAGGVKITWTIVQLLFYLILWLLLGIYIIPTLLKRARRLMNDETLLVVSLGLCLGTVLLFVYIGFSSALGAFIAGSILAGTVHSVRIEHMMKPIKDFFGAVFFISVGMMVDPAIIVEYAVPILLISLITIFGKLIFSTLGVLIAGNSLNTAVYCGASLAQIGEFSFIIALLATNLNLASGFMYPVVVSVSVITTFTTPFTIKYAERIYELVGKILPDKILSKLDDYSSNHKIRKRKDGLWKRFFNAYFTGLIVYTVVIIGVIQLNVHFVTPLLKGFLQGMGANILLTLFTLGLMAPFINSLLRPRNPDITLLMVQTKANHLPLHLFMLLRLSTAVLLVMYTINQFFELSFVWLAIPAIVVITVLSRLDFAFGKYLQIEARFLANLNEKQLSEWALNEKGASIGNWLSDELWVGHYIFIQNAASTFNQEISRGNTNILGIERGNMLLQKIFKRFRGANSDPSLSDLMMFLMTKVYGISIIKIISGEKHINIPEKTLKITQKIHVGDALYLLGTKQHIDSINSNLQFHPFLKEHSEPITLRRFIENQDSGQKEYQLICFAFSVDKVSGFVGKSIKDSGICERWNCTVIGLQRDIYPIVYPEVHTIISKGDKVWVLGDQKMFQKLLQAGLIEV
jgi:CPA2 family monovalent cation:H+ antiporter-2